MERKPFVVNFIGSYLTLVFIVWANDEAHVVSQLSDSGIIQLWESRGEGRYTLIDTKREYIDTDGNTVSYLSNNSTDRDVRQYADGFTIKPLGDERIIKIAMHEG